MRIMYLIVAVLCLLITSCSQQSSDPVDFVNPNIGGISQLLETTVPLVDLPNGMMRIYRLPGNYQAEKINGFPFILCGHRNGTAGLIMPTSGKIFADMKKWQSYYDHDFETCTPYYYSVRLEDQDIDLELTVAEKSSYYQVQWNKNEQKNVMIGVTTKGLLKVVDKNTVEGYEVYQNKVKVFFYIKTEKSFYTDTIWNENSSRNGTAELSGNNPTLGLTFQIPGQERTGIKMGVSFVDSDQARKNLESEIPDWEFRTSEKQRKGEME